MEVAASYLEDRGTVAVFGPDAPAFLQNILSCNVEKLAPAEASLGGLLTPQGKLIADLIIAKDDGDGYLIDVTRALAGALVQRLSLYRLRARVEIIDVSDRLTVAALWGGPAAFEDGLVYDDPRPGGLGKRAFLPREQACDLLAEAGVRVVVAEDYHARRIAAAIPEGGKDFALGDTFPHEANFDVLGGVDFSKGCYIGQEVVSRMQHRTNVRKRVVPVAFEDMRPMSGIDVMVGERVIGYTGTAIRGRGLAMLRLDLVNEAQASGTPVVAGGIALAPFDPSWADFGLGRPQS